MLSKSRELFQRALHFMPGGVNSPVRAFRAVGGDPLFIVSGKGSRLTDADGRSYIDYVMSWGPLILGHCHREETEAVVRALGRGTSFGASPPEEVKWAGRIGKVFPS